MQPQISWLLLDMRAFDVDVPQCIASCLSVLDAWSFALDHWQMHASITSAERCGRVHAQATPPTIFGGFALLRAVLLRERIDLVHAHGAFSAIAHEAIIHARTMGYKVGSTTRDMSAAACLADAASRPFRPLLLALT